VLVEVLVDVVVVVGHGAALQVCDSTSVSTPPYVVMQDAPPFDAAVDCAKVLDWLPVPHVWEQLPQLPHVPTQFAGHDGVLQFCDCVPAFSEP
jgi:hypothetical protein